MSEIGAEGAMGLSGPVKQPGVFRRGLGGTANKVAAIGKWFWDGIKIESSNVKPEEINAFTTARIIDQFVLNSSINRLNGPGGRTEKEFSLATIGMNMGMRKTFGDQYDYRAEFSKVDRNGINSYEALRKSLDTLVQVGVLERNLREEQDNFGETISYKVKNEELLSKIRKAEVKVEDLLIA